MLQINFATQNCFSNKIILDQNQSVYHSSCHALFETLEDFSCYVMSTMGHFFLLCTTIWMLSSAALNAFLDTFSALRNVAKPIRFRNSFFQFHDPQRSKKYWKTCKQ